MAPNEDIDDEFNEKESEIWADGYETGKNETEEEDPFRDGIQTRYLDGKEVTLQLKAARVDGFENVMNEFLSSGTKCIKKIIAIGDDIIFFYYDLED